MGVYEVCQHITTDQRNNFKTQHLIRPAKYVSRDIEVRSCNRCRSRKISKYCKFWVCVCGLEDWAYNAHASYCYLLPGRLYNIFPHYLTNGTIS